jgi:hypothetical protein
LLLVAVLVLGACGSSSKSSNGSTTTGPSGASANAGTTAAAGGVASANDIGITPTQIKIAVISDVNTPYEPGLFQKNVNMVKSWADQLNAKGGLAGRQIVVDFCDGKSDANATGNCIIQACTSDFAMVGTAALNVTAADVSDFQDCKNASGQTVGMPNIPGIDISTSALCSSVEFPPTSNDPTLCSTQNSSTKVYTLNRGDAVYYAKQFPGIHGIFLISSSSPQIDAQQTALNNGRIAAGIKADTTTQYASPEIPTAAQMQPYIEDIKRYGSTYVQDDAGPDNSVELAKEAALQGVTTVKVWGGNQGNYGTTFIQQGGSAVNNTYADIVYLPYLTEYQSNPTLAAEINAVGGVGKIDGNALSSYISALLFQDAVQKTVASGTSLSRQSLLNTLKTNEKAFTADGLIGTTDVSAKAPSPCIVVVGVINGQWQRVYPTQSGQFDCNSANITTESVKTGS